MVYMAVKNHPKMEEDDEDDSDEDDEDEIGMFFCVSVVRFLSLLMYVCRTILYPKVCYYTSLILESI